jgi:Holliday junction resolvasome RuvABC DNA-binding subunit
MNIAEALVSLGYKEFVVRGDNFDAIEWIQEPSKKPTQKEVTDAIAAAPTDEQKKAERTSKLDSAITKLKALGLTESEAKIIIGLE